MEKELKLGIMTNAELAEWFGVKEATLSKTKSKKLEILKEYAEFEKMTGRVNITKILFPVYTKTSANYQKVKAGFLKHLDTGKKFPDSNDYFDSCSLISERIIGDETIDLNIKDSSTYIYTLKAKGEDWGKNNLYKSGKIGVSIYEWGKIIDNRVFPLTDQELMKLKEIIRIHMADAAEKQLMVDKMISAGELNESQAWAYLSKITNMKNSYQEIRKSFSKEFEYPITRGTRFIEDGFQVYGDLD